ncbi:hypothetical protein BH10CYA1_BH10CYA1_29190 [soil metagenome]
MTGEFLNQFKQNEDVELVPEGSIQSESSTEIDPAQVPATAELSALPPASDLVETTSAPDGGTPWKKRKGNKSYRRNFFSIALVTVLIICGTLYSAVLAIPNGPSLVLSQIGIVIGNRWLILKAYDIGFQNSPYSISNLVVWANERAAYNKLDAIQLYNDCLAINPKYPPTYLNRGATYYYLKEYEKAMADYDKAIELNPHYALALDNRASLWIGSDQLEKALADETKAIADRPEFRTYYFNRARIYRKLKRYDEALKDFSKAKDLGENYHRVQHEIDATRQLLN